MFQPDQVGIDAALHPKKLSVKDFIQNSLEFRPFSPSFDSAGCGGSPISHSGGCGCIKSKPEKLPDPRPLPLSEFPFRLFSLQSVSLRLTLVVKRSTASVKRYCFLLAFSCPVITPQPATMQSIKNCVKVIPRFLDSSWSLFFMNGRTITPIVVDLVLSASSIVCSFISTRFPSLLCSGILAHIRPGFYQSGHGS